ncbi:MAG TPA: OadG family transporter subunit [Melioribacteraceae bacterium]|nr:OadG family transporter subunit [Melioribacteraceae bacterium]
MIIAQAVAAADSLAKSRIAENSKKFLDIDPWGVGMTFIGMAVVFLSLLLLYMLFYNITKALNYRIKSNLKKEGKELPAKGKDVELSGEVNAAIAIALHLYMNELHDQESAILTINKVARTYSPWSSKIYGIRQFPR